MALSQTLIDAINYTVEAAEAPTTLTPGKLVFIAEIDRFNIVSESEVIFRAATRTFVSNPSDSSANEPYLNRLQIPSLEQSIIGNGDYERTATIAPDEINLINTDGYLDSEFAHSTYNWRGTRLVLLVGLDTWDRADFEVVPGGQMRITDVKLTERLVKLKVVPLHDRPDRPVQPNRYGGWGQSYDFAGTADVDCDNTFNLGKRDVTIQIRFKTSGSGSVESLLTKRASFAASGAAGWFIAKNASDVLAFNLDDGSNALGTTTVGSASEYTDDAWHMLTMTIDRTNDVVNVWVDTTKEVTDADISSITGAISSSDIFSHGADSSGTSNWSGELDEPRVWYRILADNEIASSVQFSIDGVEPALMGAWRYDEESGTTMLCEVLGPMNIQAGFGGSNRVTMGDTADPGSGSFMLTGWWRGQGSGDEVIASRKQTISTADAGYAVQLDTNGTDINFIASDGSTQYETSVTLTDTKDHTWYGFALVVDRTLDELRGYVLDYPRGTLTAATAQDITGAGSFSPGTKDFRLGELANTAQRFTGYLSWVFYAESVPTEAEIIAVLSEQDKELYIDGAPTAPPAIDRLTDGVEAHWWPLDENTGTTATDQIASSNGTFLTTPDWISKDGVLTAGGSGARATTLEGFPEIKGKLKPLALGRPQSIRPILVDPYRRIYQYSDPDWGSTQEIEEVRAGAVALTGGGTDYTGDTTNNTITLTAVQEEEINMDVKGLQDPGDSDRWLRFPGEIVSKVWRKGLGLPDAQVDTTSIQAYDDRFPFQSSIYLGACETQLKDFNCAMLGPLGYAYRSADNKLTLAWRKAPDAADAVLDIESNMISDIKQIDLPPPSWMVRIGYRKTWHTLKSFDASVTAIDQQKDQEVWRYAQASLTAVLDNYADALPRTYKTVHHKRRDSQILAQVTLNLDDTPWVGWEVTLTYNHWSVGISDTVNINTYSRYDVAGYPYVVLGHRYAMVKNKPVTVLQVARPL